MLHELGCSAFRVRVARLHHFQGTQPRKACKQRKTCKTLRSRQAGVRSQAARQACGKQKVPSHNFEVLSLLSQAGDS